MLPAPISIPAASVLGFHGDSANFSGFVWSFSLTSPPLPLLNPRQDTQRERERDIENMKCAEIAMRVFLFVLLSRVCEGQTADCAQLESCEPCVTGDASLNLTDCVWVRCQSEILCVSKTSDSLSNCTIYNEPSMCEVLPLTSLAPVPVSNTTSTTTVSTTAAAVTTTTKEVSTTIAEPTSTTEIPTTAPVYAPSSFDPASFIGGIVLVLGAEAAFFFAIKFFKARDGTYQTLI
ncbi:sialomucin core protein 24 isoform X1 [Heptranchias perlo]|uniref:sialomucin core protein 24 isoform X1 n=1 Tax=Heptranchias perlo TaxID=212740 RepID=UPI00355A7D91